ncbi:lipid A biosynthesis lauroyl acyltransferase [Pandoraea nosoerga]|uniref:Lipid A biosynthesis lauroyl acyltransferase n=1 Tax=Pandoraea nosoerga TaxID=2508296 RepID=A0A5E4S5Q9_9BURK|nr:MULTISPECIES: lipid A biosynthesis lauroyl acyltransferase [Pandoraea]MBN4667399.1 lipid A biosynthesis lauroyl acyltransferase [Pandoraea nosoerga]MBN4677373.1 lipid A biosynthesis lauroyl acyltransferase [Pandoraea nosoerga]MBN4682237.1 lipid A biosynthesis lauroyl acyltransferase [Pandoraea nosoerga]MBN4746494.1 lipid A biosynthesis lauroyl acyltransferase [Pandoraea nosoerga]VVD70930.1 lipid A biosynthesis lauroyl acyltransferase [Pandoraea nosoerga]
MATTPKKSLGYYLGVGLLRGLNLLPYSWVARFGAGLGRLLYAIPSSRRRVVHTNLRLCFPDWDDATRERVAKAAFVHAIRSYAERSVQWFAGGKKMERLVALDSAIDLLDPDLPPTIFLGFHFVGIEAGSIFLNYSLHRPCASLYTPMSNPAFDAMAREQRGRFDAEMIPRGDSARDVLRVLRKRKPVMLAADMDYGTRNSTFVPFFGVQACTLTAISRLAQVGRAQVVPFVTEVLPNYRGYRLKIFPAWQNYPSDDPDADARTMNAFLEEQILKMPEQYYWVHKRFKTRPQGQPGVY